MTDAQSQPQLSVVMITLNEQEAVGKVVNDIKQVSPHAEIVVVDSSSDCTAEIAESLGCRVIRQLPPQGYGPALDEALQAAAGRTVVTMDCDDTYPAEAIPQLLSQIDAGYDLVSASRLKSKPQAMPWPNYVANRLFVYLTRLICGVSASDVHTGMRAYKSEVVKQFNYDPHGMALPVELLVGPVRAGWKHGEIFIDYRKRIGDTTLHPLQGTFWTLKRLWKWRRWHNKDATK